MKRILYLSFYFEPDLSAGSFRNSPLVKELSKQVKGVAEIDLITTLPNRYSSFEASAPLYEERDNCFIYRIAIPKHESGMRDQVVSFKKYYQQVKEIVKGKKYDLVIASSSRLFTAYLGYSISKKLRAPLYLDIRDIFYDTLVDVLDDGIVKRIALPVIKKIEQRTFSYASHINLISGGFKPYFQQYDKVAYSYYPNGIDNVFIEANKEPIEEMKNSKIKTITYAGNIGEGQGLHKIIPKAAKALENKFKFLIIGDGGAKYKLEKEIEKLQLSNIELLPPMDRKQLIETYKASDFLFAHLNNYAAFDKVLPSKLFELATFSKPVIAGVGGFAADFVKMNIDNAILFEPCNVDQFVEKLTSYSYYQVKRDKFIEQFKRDNVNMEMAASMLKYI